MKILYTALICGVVLEGTAGAASAQPNAPPSYEDARQSSWTLTAILIEALEDADAKEWPGTHAWLKDLREQMKGVTKDTPLEKWPNVDIGALVDHNSNFWRMYFEIAPADPTFTVIHGGLLLSQGEAKRAAYMLELGRHRPGIPKPTLGGMNGLGNSAITALMASDEVTEQGTKLFDRGDFDAAIKKYREAHKLCPTNGWTYYEMAYTERTKAQVARGETREKPGTMRVNVVMKDSPAVVAALAEARRHDPLQYMAYQGSDPEVIKGFSALVQKVQPAWQALRQPRVTKADEYHALQELSEGFLQAGIYDLAILARQLMAARRNSYDPTDYPIFEACLRKLAPGPTTEEILMRLAGKNGAMLKCRPLTKLDIEEGQPVLGSGERLYIPAGAEQKADINKPVRVDFIRVLTPEEEIAKRTTVEDLTKFSKDFRAVAEQVLGKSKLPCKVLVRFACGPAGHNAEIRHKPNELDEKSLNELQEGIAKLPKLPVKEKTVEFEVQLSVTPVKEVQVHEK